MADNHLTNSDKLNTPFNLKEQQANVGENLERQGLPANVVTQAKQALEVIYDHAGPNATMGEVLEEGYKEGLPTRPMAEIGHGKGPSR